MSSAFVPTISTQDVSEIFSAALVSERKAPNLFLGVDASSVSQIAKNVLGPDVVDVSTSFARPALANYSLAGKSAVMVLSPAQLFAGMNELADPNPMKFQDEVAGIFRGERAALADSLSLLGSANKAVILVDIEATSSPSHVAVALSLAEGRSSVFPLPKNLSFGFVADSSYVPSVSIRNRCSIFVVSDAPKSRLNTSAMEEGSAGPSISSSPPRP